MSDSVQGSGSVIRDRDVSVLHLDPGASALHADSEVSDLHIELDVTEDVTAEAFVSDDDTDVGADVGQSEVDRLAACITQRRGQLAVKRIMDLLGGAILAILLAPLLLLLTLAVWVSSRGPVLYRQERIGVSGKRFSMIKFRTMYVDLPQEIVEEIRLHEQNGDLFKSENDPRITPVGRWLRRYSMDELPQLFNVLGGTMSLVGPRPLMLHMAEPYPNFVAARSMVRPGITGLWQVLDREHATNASFMIRHDLEYVERFSLTLDMKILLLTLPATLTAAGAH
ncbi:MAG TPA: sugar transferase [Gammaproteobacteria bacterium]|nr:sugar transferase [Gammaproteobacteria bacterium]